MPLVDMEADSPLVPARKLTIVRPSHHRNTKSDHSPAFDLFAVLDPFRNSTLESIENDSRQSWLRHCSSGALEGVRVVAFGDVQPDDLVAEQSAGIEKFSIELLSSFLQLRRSTGTVCSACYKKNLLF